MGYETLAALRPSLAETHHTIARWPAWMKEMVPALEEVGPGCQELSEALEVWVEFEDVMSYPESKVNLSHLAI